MKKIEKTTKEYIEHFNALSANFSVDLFQLIVCNMIPVEFNKLDEFKKMFEEIKLDSLYESWHKFRVFLPNISDKSYLLFQTSLLKFLINHFELKIKTAKVDYNSIFYLELDELYKNERKISVYDVIETNFLKKIELARIIIDAIELQIELIDSKIKNKELILNNKITALEKKVSEQETKISLLENTKSSFQIKYKATQTKMVCYYLIGEKLGIFHKPEEEKILNKIMDNALFKKDGNFVPASSIGSILSRTRRGEEIPGIIKLNRDIKTQMIKELELMLEEFKKPNSNISIFRD